MNRLHEYLRRNNPDTPVAVIYTLWALLAGLAVLAVMIATGPNLYADPEVPEPPVYTGGEYIYWRIIIIPELNDCLIDIQDDFTVVEMLYP